MGVCVRSEQAEIGDALTGADKGLCHLERSYSFFYDTQLFVSYSNKNSGGVQKNCTPATASKSKQKEDDPLSI